MPPKAISKLPSSSPSGATLTNEERLVADKLSQGKQRHIEELTRLQSSFDGMTRHLRAVYEEALSGVRKEHHMEMSLIETRFHEGEAALQRSSQERKEEARRLYEEELTRIQQDLDKETVPLRALLDEETAELQRNIAAKIVPLQVAVKRGTTRAKRQFEAGIKLLDIELHEVQAPLHLRLHEMRYSRYRSTLISRLPDEVLSMIFVWALAMERPTTYCTRSLPLNVFCVSSYWRMVTMSTPRLWTNLCVSTDVPYFKQFRTKHDLEALTNRVARSKAVLIDVSVGKERRYLQAWNGMSEIERFTLIVDVVAPHFPRCRTLILHLPWYTVPWIQQQRLKMPQLEELTVTVTEHVSDDCKAVFPLPETTSRLTKLCLRNIMAYAAGERELKLLLGGLLELRLVHSTVVSLTGGMSEEEEIRSLVNQASSRPLELSVLQQADKLTTSCLQDLHISHPLDAGLAQLSRLRSLHIRTTEGRRASATILTLSSWMMMPVLRQLTIVSGSVNSSDFAAIDDLLTPPTNMPLLEELTLFRVQFSPSNLLQFLESVPGLRILNLWHVPVPVAFLDGLSAKKQMILCPQLRQLDIVHVLTTSELPSIGYRSFTLASLKRMLASRKAAAGAATVQNLVWRGWATHPGKSVEKEVLGLLEYVETLEIQVYGDHLTEPACFACC